MFKTLHCIIVLFVVIANSSYAQKEPSSKKSISEKITQARNALFDLNCEKSLQLAQEALSEANQIDDDLLKAKAYNVIATNFLEFSDTQKAEQYYTKALHHAKLVKNDTVQDWVYNNMGALYAYYQDNFEKGMEYYKKGLVFTEKTKNPIQITYNSLNISGAYFDEGRFDEGFPYISKAEKYMKFHDEIEARITYYSQLGNYYSHKGNNQKAEENFKKAISYGKNSTTNLLDSYLADVYFLFSKYYLKNKKYEEAYHYLELYSTTKEKIYNEERSNKVKDFENKIEIEEYKRQIDFIESEKQQKEKSLQKTWIIILLCLISMIILFAFAYTSFRNSKLRRKNYEDLKKVNKELKEAKEKAEEVTKLKSQFVSTITHELRTPLYGVIGITDIINKEHPELSGSKYLSSLKFSAKYLLSLVNDILQMNKISERKIVLEDVPFNIREELESIKNSFDVLSFKNKNNISIEIDSSVPKFLIGDRIRLSQIFMNLISNSLKFTINGKVEVKARVLTKENNICQLEFQVIDNGIGISKEYHEKIFEEFVQIERRDDDYQGTGLGLPIVKKLVALFGGTIHLESEEHKGTKVLFTANLKCADTLENQDIIEKVTRTDELEKLGKIKVLLVEDNKINQIVTEKILKGFNFEITIVESGFEAIKILEDAYFDVVLMDINMPLLNGFETTRILRNKGIKTPIIALTAFDKHEINDEILKSGMDAVMIKPFDSKVLYDMIVEIVTKHKKENLSK
ncbi:ATP-binding response regulator [Flavobacterium luminosum]|uniref:histidine kinase n=1 Tax=Flavobacterium luminosum TaxID=2949086 RepID=A0ABT0TRU1_9FLAO|nr:ATP-binding protein [Flavobacterium sp. HXWNR70]MCL9810090.1 ATP-binding protein [Flavobacterium sp. HXWNR70]